MKGRTAMIDYIVDISLGVIFLIVTFVYYKRGFVRSVMGVVSWIASVVGARILSKSVTEWIVANTSLFQDTEPFVAKMIIFVFLFIFFGLIIKAICMLINKVFELPLLKQVNKALGLLLGMVCGIFCVIVLSVCLQIGSKVVYNDEYKSFVDNSYIVQFIASNEQTVKEVASQQKSEG